MPAVPPGPQFPDVSAEARSHSERLCASIRDEIAASRGWITFARFMQMALYEPGQGYYVAGATKLGQAGDFVTAPEISPLFGKTLARQVAQVLELAGGESVLELGAGSGAMAADVLDELRNIDRLPRRYLILETSPQLAQRQRRTLQQRNLPDDRIEWIDALPEQFDGLVIANEVLDALPVHLVAWRRDGMHERGVGWEDGFVWKERLLEPGTLRSAAQTIAPAPEYLSEISLLVPALVRSLAACLQRGALLFIDYGFGRREYYHPQRSRGTLMCHYRHCAHDDPFFLPGLQDITAHVDFTAVAHAGTESGLDLLGYTTQAQFLINCGITGLLEQQGGTSSAAHFAKTAGAQKLLSPAEMGELFKVIALGRGIDGPLIGFTSGDKSRLL